MRVLERNAEITTRYGGGFVQSIDGLEADEGADGPLDWFFYVNGVESTVGAADYAAAAAARRSGGTTATGRPRCGCRPWSAPGRSPSPAATTAGASRSRSSAAAAAAACGLVRRAARGRRRHGRRRAPPDGAIRVLVGPWARLRDDPAAAQIEKGPQASGVFAGFSSARRPPGCRLEALDESGRPGARPRRRRRPGRRDPPLRSAADLGRDRLRRRRRSPAAAGAARRGRPRATTTRCSPKPTAGSSRCRSPATAADEVALRLRAAPAAAAGGLAGRRGRLPRRAGRRRLRLLQPVGAGRGRRRRGPRRLPRRAPAARCGRRCAWASRWRC